MLENVRDFPEERCTWQLIEDNGVHLFIPIAANRLVSETDDDNNDDDEDDEDDDEVFV